MAYRNRELREFALCGHGLAETPSRRLRVAHRALGIGTRSFRARRQAAVALVLFLALALLAGPAFAADMDELGSEVSTAQKELNEAKKAEQDVAAKIKKNLEKQSGAKGDELNRLKAEGKNLDGDLNTATGTR